MEDLYINRELSWLKFNQRVLDQAGLADIPLFERLKFVAIFASNLDEFYMVRVGSLYDRSLFDPESLDNKTGMTPAEQISAVNADVKKLYPLRDAAYEAVMADMPDGAPRHVAIKSLGGGERRIVKTFFELEVQPLLSPQIVDSHHPFPHLENRQLYVGVRLKNKDHKLFGIIPLPRELDRVYSIPGTALFCLMEDIVLYYADLVFESYPLEAKAVFRVTRNADIEYIEDEMGRDTEYRKRMQELLKKRRRLSPVRLETDSDADADLYAFFVAKLHLSKKQCFVCKTPLDLSFVFKVEDSLVLPMREKLLYTPRKPQWPAGVRRGDINGQIRQGDILLFYPYHSMRPMIELIREASEDPSVVSIKMTLYRIGRQSLIVQSLCAAAESGKDVTVILELRARFDEQNNINWSNILEEAGCRIIYGIDEYKVHGKIVLITRHGKTGPEYTVNIATGNYNESTAKQYADLSLFTTEENICRDAVQFFHTMETGNLTGSYRKLLVAPLGLKPRLLALIDGQRRQAEEGRPARILAKMNSLTDKELIDALAQASQAGVKITLLIRGICCLRPGVKGLTENIEVRSIVGRFLEHSRIYCFGEGHDQLIYIGSTDLMTRNTERRIEILVPVDDRRLAAQLRHYLSLQLRDNVKASLIGPDGGYTRIDDGQPPFDSQMEFYSETYRQAEAATAHEAPAEKKWQWLLRFLPRP